MFQVIFFPLPVKEFVFMYFSHTAVKQDRNNKELLSICLFCILTDLSSFQAAIRKELNEFKSTEMEVHELSRHLTRLVHSGVLFLLFLFFCFFCLMVISASQLTVPSGVGLQVCGGRDAGGDERRSS